MLFKFYALSFICLLSLTGCSVNPVTGKQQLMFSSIAKDIQIGKEQYLPAQQSQGGMYYLDENLHTYISAVGNKLASVSDQPQLPYEFVVLNNSVPNAWALPSGKIAINRGLLVQLENEAQLAAVLSHEIVHAAARHGAQRMRDNLIVQAGMTGLNLGLTLTNNNYRDLIIGGAMAYPFLKAKGGEVGNSLCGDEDVELAKSILRADRSNKIMLPSDHVISATFDGAPSDCATSKIPENMMALDIGINTVTRYSDVLKTAKTVLWNGPMGVFEMESFANGTIELGNSIAEATKNGAFSLVGGGDSVAAVKQFGFENKVSYVSTGGGAMLESLEGKTLPGIAAILE